MADAVMAASTALPPARSTSMAARVASGDEVAAMPFVPTATDLPGWSKFLMPSSFVACGKNCLKTVASSIAL
jgi:hypothetical protein